MGSGPSEALRPHEVTAGTGRFAVQDSRGGEAAQSLECVGFGFVQIAIELHSVIDGFAAFAIAGDVLRPVVTVRDDVQVQTAPSGHVEVPTSYLEGHKERPGESASCGFEESVHDGRVIDAVRCVAYRRVEVRNREAVETRARAE